MNRTAKSVILGLALGSIALVTPSYAVGLLGHTVNVTVNFPDSGTVFVDAGDSVVGAGIEYPLGSFITYSSDISMDLTDSQIIISTSHIDTVFTSALFNGFVITVFDGTFTSATANGLSLFSPTDITISGNQLFLNYQSAIAEIVSIIDVDVAPAVTAVPLPTALPLFATGLASLGLLGWRRRKQAA